MMSGKMIRIRSDRTRVLGEWLLLFLLSPHGQAELERLKVGSSDSSVSIGADVLLKIQIPELSLEEQSRIVAEMTSLAAAQRRVDELLEEVEIQLDTARASVLHRAFSGSEEEL
jgi:restriction endonuclease S subunit